MIGRQRRIGRAALQRHRRAAVIDHEAVGLVARARAAHVADVVHDQGQREMQPVGRLQRLPQQAPAQDGLAHEGRQRGVIGVVVERIAVGDPLDHQLAGALEDAPVFRLPAAKSPVIGLREMASQRFRYQGGRIEHPRLHRTREPSIGPAGTSAVVRFRAGSALCLVALPALSHRPRALGGDEHAVLIAPSCAPRCARSPPASCRTGDAPMAATHSPPGAWDRRPGNSWPGSRAACRRGGRAGIRRAGFRYRIPGG